MQTARDTLKQLTHKTRVSEIHGDDCRIAVEDRVTSMCCPLSALTLRLTCVHLPPITFNPGFWTQSLTLHKTNTLKTAGPEPPRHLDEIAHSQSHGQTVAINTEKREGGGWDL